MLQRKGYLLEDSMLKSEFLRVKTTCIWSLEPNREKFNLLIIFRDTSLERGLHYEIDSQKRPYTSEVLSP